MAENKKIDNEIQNAKDGFESGIWIKCNAIVDQKIIDWLADEFKKDEGLDLKRVAMQHQASQSRCNLSRYQGGL